MPQGRLSLLAPRQFGPERLGNARGFYRLNQVGQFAFGIDRNANLVVIELKRTEDGGHMELQAIRYAAMISTLTFGQVVETYGRYLRQRQDERDPQVETRTQKGATPPLYL